MYKTYLEYCEAKLKSAINDEFDLSKRLDSLREKCREAQECMADLSRTVDGIKNAPTKTKREVMAKANELDIEVSDCSYEDYYNVEIIAPNGFQFEENECQSKEFDCDKYSYTKGMMWQLVYDCLELQERDEDE